MGLKVFVDSDVVISSIISSKGAAFLLLNEIDNLELFLSNVSLKELKLVIERFHLDKQKLNDLVNKRFTKVNLKETTKELKKTFEDYVLDINDAHIVAGAARSKTQFLISYNTRHFKADKLKEDFKIILTTPANLIQYLRSS